MGRAGHMKLPFHVTKLPGTKAEELLLPLDKAGTHWLASVSTTSSPRLMYFLHYFNGHS